MSQSVFRVSVKSLTGVLTNRPSELKLRAVGQTARVQHRGSQMDLRWSTGGVQNQALRDTPWRLRQQTCRMRKGKAVGLQLSPVWFSAQTSHSEVDTSEESENLPGLKGFQRSTLLLPVTHGTVCLSSTSRYILERNAEDMR